jgi:VWFA-related protein
MGFGLPLMALFWAAAALSQNTPHQETTKAAKDPGATFQSGVNLVLVPVVIRDAQGRAIGKLTKDDFQLFDGGKRQTIASFSAVGREGGGSEPTAPMTATREAENGSETRTPSSTTVANSTPERFLIYLFDDRNIDFARMVAVREGAERHLKRGLAATDRAAIYTFSGRDTLEFTGDRDKLEAALAKLSVQGQPDNGESQCPGVSYYLADLILNKGDQRAHEAVVAHTMGCAQVPKKVAEDLAWSTERRALSFGLPDSAIALGALRRAVLRLAKMPGQRLIVLASPGFFAQTPELTRETAEVLNLAAKAHVVISGLDPSGVPVAQLDASDRTGNSQWPQYQLQSAQVDGDVVAELAKGTGGLFFRDNNDLTTGFDRTAVAPQFSYVLGFSPTVFKPDGSFHLLKIRLTARKGLSVEARRGYYALKPDTEDQTVKEEIDEEVFSRDRINDIPVILETGSSKVNGADHATVMVVAKVDANSLHFQKADGLSCDSLIFVSVLFDPDGGYVTGMTKTVNLRLRPETLTRLIASGITLRSDLDAKVGIYTIRLVLREAQSKAMTTITSPLRIF